MTRIRLITAVALLALGGMVFSGAAQNSKTTLTGVVTDTMCGAKHMIPDKSAAECTRICVKQGSQYALLAGGKIYALQGDTAAMDKLAGQPATVTGTLNGNTVVVEAIKPAVKAS
jgi:hypothetical protein